MPIPLPIETERLLVRPFVPERDSKAMAGIYGDADVMRYVPGGALQAEAVRAALEDHARAQRERGFSSWALVERSSGRVVGDVGFGIFEATGDVELGYTLARAVWGRGYATEAAGACLAAALAHLDVPRIVAIVDRDNVRSLAVPERIGMKPVGTIDAYGRPHVVFATVQ